MSGTRTETRLFSSLARSLSARHGGFAYRLTVHVLPYMYYVPTLWEKCVCSLPQMFLKGQVLSEGTKRSF